MISWLRTVSTYEGENSLLGITVRSAIAWCDGYTVPLVSLQFPGNMKVNLTCVKSFWQLVPLTGWLPVPLPSQIRCMTVPGGRITHFEVSPCKQHLIIARKTGDPELWHIMGNRYIGSFKGEFDARSDHNFMEHLTSLKTFDSWTFMMRERLYE